MMNKLIATAALAAFMAMPAMAAKPKRALTEKEAFVAGEGFAADFQQNSLIFRCCHVRPTPWYLFQCGAQPSHAPILPYFS